MPWIADREAADPVLAVGIDEIGEAHVGPALALLHLLAKEGQPGLSRCRRGRGRRRPRAGSATGRPCRAAVSQCSAMILSSIAWASANRLRRALADHRIVEDRGIIAGQLPGAEEGRPVDRVAQVAQRPFAEAGGRRAAAARGALPAGSKAKALARASSSVASSLWPLPARASRIASIIARRSSRSSGSRWVSETSDEATPTARLASRTWITGPS